MKVFSTLVLLALVGLLVSSVDAGKKKKAPSSNRANKLEDPISDEDHFHEGKHSDKYDHDAFLGDEQAKDYDKLSPAETKKRLRALFPKIDVDGDKKVSLKELKEWIEVNMKRHVEKNTDERMKELDKDKDGKVSWDEYASVEYSDGNSDGLTKEHIQDLMKMKERDQKRWKHADMDNDGLLTRSEMALMLHPEETPRMTNVLVQENMDILDKDGDGVISFKEYADAGEDAKDEDKETLNALKETFNKDLDKDKDGVLNRDELRDWIMPGMETDPVQGEANHLMKESDFNKDNFLSLNEIIKNYELFAGSKATTYGEMLQDRTDL